MGRHREGLSEGTDETIALKLREGVCQTRS
jgi:hypothetical protein